eukprot:EC724204.1.p1 GENE.EC724204.1~~EC724204.1.p1  ORF type:complete len:134 (+),score=12.08 EC724204.1:102-503(+)
MSDILRNVRLQESECLNTDDSLESFVQGKSAITSEADAQLLFNLHFGGDAALSAFAITGPANGSAPKTVHLFVDRGNLSFEQTSGIDPDFKIVLTASDVATGKAHAITSSRFASLPGFLSSLRTTKAIWSRLL